MCWPTQKRSALRSWHDVHSCPTFYDVTHTNLKTQNAVFMTNKHNFFNKLDYKFILEKKCLKTCVCFLFFVFLSVCLVWKCIVSWFNPQNLTLACLKNVFDVIMLLAHPSLCSELCHHSPVLMVSRHSQTILNSAITAQFWWCLDIHKLFSTLPSQPSSDGVETFTNCSQLCHHSLVLMVSSYSQTIFNSAITA